MSSARDSNWRPQPPNLQELEKKEAAAMPVMLSALVHPPGEEAGRPGAGEVSRVFGLTGVGAPLSAERRSRHRGRQTGQRRTQLGSRRDGGGWDGLRLAGGRLRHNLSTCRDVWLLRFY